ncbi:hypothetical protein [Paucilactobacillus kaifaensis]|uniref:hypothetical protein n=1 Tax=Paucilactobacillus kaifaensis TaxID=2559921 RepID=UPI0010F7FA35|nr:hypothetical protein [Paucilactobacillus kaifaensis]
MWLENECKYDRFQVTCNQCPMIKRGFQGQVVKEYENTYLIELDMNTVCNQDRKSLMRIPEFNGRVVIGKKHIRTLTERQQDLA